MNNGSTVARDKYGFEIGSARNKVAALVDKGLTIDQLKAKGFSKQTIYATRHAMKVSKGLPLDERFTKKSARKTTTPPVVQFHPETKAFRVKALIDSGKSDDEIIAAGFTKQDIWSTRWQTKKKIEAGKPGKALVAVDNAVASVKRDKKRFAAILQAATGASPARRPKPTNGHAPPFSVPVVEAIFHIPGGGEVPIFSSVDIFPQVYAMAARKLGFLK